MSLECVVPDSLPCNCSVNAKRIILRKGHPGVCFYFIFSGSTFVNVEDRNNNDELFTKTAAILHRGESFGVSICHHFFQREWRGKGRGRRAEVGEKEEGRKEDSERARE